MSTLKALMIAAAVSVAIPAIAADAPATPQPPVEKATAKDQAAKAGAEKEQVAVGVAPALPQVGKKDEKSGNGATAPQPQTQTLRFERWVHDEDGEY